MRRLLAALLALAPALAPGGAAAQDARWAPMRGVTSAALAGEGWALVGTGATPYAVEEGDPSSVEPVFDRTAGLVVVTFWASPDGDLARCATTTDLDQFRDIADLCWGLSR